MLPLPMCPWRAPWPDACPHRGKRGPSQDAPPPVSFPPQQQGDMFKRRSILMPHAMLMPRLTSSCSLHLMPRNSQLPPVTVRHTIFMCHALAPEPLLPSHFGPTCQARRTHVEARGAVCPSSLLA